MIICPGPTLFCANEQDMRKSLLPTLSCEAPMHLFNWDPSLIEVQVERHPLDNDPRFYGTTRAFLSISRSKDLLQKLILTVLVHASWPRGECNPFRYNLFNQPLSLDDRGVLVQSQLSIRYFNFIPNFGLLMTLSDTKKLIDVDPYPLSTLAKLPIGISF